MNREVKEIPNDVMPKLFKTLLDHLNLKVVLEYDRDPFGWSKETYVIVPKTTSRREEGCEL